MAHGPRAFMYILSASLQFTIFLGLFHLKHRKFDVLTPGFGPKRGFIDLQNPGDGYFCIVTTCVVQEQQLFISIFTIHNFSGPTSPKNRKFDVFTPRFGPNEGLNDPQNPGNGYFIILIPVWYTLSSYLSVSLQFTIYLGLFLLKKVNLMYLVPKRYLMTS